MDDGGLAEWLRHLGDGGLATLIARRADVVLGDPPGTLGELAERLSRPGSLLAAARRLTLPGIQVVEALLALGERATRAELRDLLAGPAGEAHDLAVAGVLTELGGLALVWPGRADRLHLAAGWQELLPSPLGLGSSLRTLWTAQPVDTIKRALRMLGGTVGGRKAEALDALVTRLADPDLVRQVAGSAPPTVAAGLDRLAGRGLDTEVSDLRRDPQGYQDRLATLRWGLEHGLLVGAPGRYEAAMPAEVALALRGADRRAPFRPDSPRVPTTVLADELLDSAATSAATSFLAHALALLDHMAGTPVPRLTGGGIGVRELGRLAKQLGTDDREIRLLIELAAAGGLLEADAGMLSVGAAFRSWRATEPADQLTGLLDAWWAHPVVPSEARDADGKTQPALRRREPCAGCQASRAALLHAAASLGPRASAARTDLAELARWTRPLVHVLAQDADDPFATVWREAELLGVLAAGALTPLGATLLAGDLDAVHDRCRRMLPEATDEAVFGSDLTVLVAGTPSARVTELLDGCADRESRGAATMWRLSPASVRRAFDNGSGASELVDQLMDVATRELPQPLVYLINDVARRYGRLRVAPSVSVIRSEDEALLAEVVADRRLVELGLRLLAPTVAGCDVPLDAALARLREVGYFPAPDAEGSPRRPDTGAARSARESAGSASPRLRRRPAPSGRPPRRPEPVTPATPTELAEKLLAEGVTAAPRPRSGVSARLLALGGHLRVTEADDLARVIEGGGRVRIEYRSASGACTSRVIGDPQLVGSDIYAWCELRNGERAFTVSRILSVDPLG